VWIILETDLPRDLRNYICIYRARGGVVVKALCYKPAGRGFIPDGVIGIFQ
jgi:hypothetical protein